MKIFAEHDEKSGKYYATFDMDEEPSTRALIERYDEHSMWEELRDWLSERDFFAKYTREEINAMSDAERFTKRMDCEVVWGEEFEKYGIQRLTIDEKRKE